MWTILFLTKEFLVKGDLYEANLLGANISGAVFEEANLSNAIWVDGKKCSLGSIGTCQ